MSEMTKRTELWRQLPLSTPFSVHIFPSYFCNFKCSYCLHSLSDEVLEKKGFKRQFMDFDLYKKVIDDILKFDQKLKALIFAGHGEPLVHKDIARMVAYAKEKKIANRVEIVSNGSLLTRKLSDELIAAGLDRLRISVQGINGAAYKKTMGKDFDFDGFVNNLHYFYKSKKHTEVYCKIIDVAMEGKEDEEKFREIFSEVADEVAIEYEIPFVKEVNNAALKESFDCSKIGENIINAKVCSMPFYMLVVTPNGDVTTCCSTDTPITLGNVLETSLVDIWQSPRRIGFCRVHLLENREMHPICSACSVPSFGLQAGDFLDEHAKELLKHYMVKGAVNP